MVKKVRLLESDGGAGRHHGQKHAFAMLFQAQTMGSQGENDEFWSSKHAFMYFAHERPRDHACNRILLTLYPRHRLIFTTNRRFSTMKTGTGAPFSYLRTGPAPPYQPGAPSERLPVGRTELAGGIHRHFHEIRTGRRSARGKRTTYMPKGT